MEQKKSNTPLISTEELHKILGKPNVKVFDVRGTWVKILEHCMMTT